MSIIHFSSETNNSLHAQFLTMPPSNHKNRPDSPESMRKQPTQERAQRTIETIFEATAQIIDEAGETAMTTNKIAHKAGFSIGTLYQYFPTKEAILMAMINRSRRQVMDDMHEMLARAVREQTDPQQVIRERLHVLVQSFGSGGKFKRSMIRLGWRMDHHENIMQAMREGAEHIAMALSQLNSPHMRTPGAATVFVLTRAVMGVIRSASLEESPLLGTQELEDELFLLTWGLLRA